MSMSIFEKWTDLQDTEKYIEEQDDLMVLSETLKEKRQ